MPNWTEENYEKLNLAVQNIGIRQQMDHITVINFIVGEIEEISTELKELVSWVQELSERVPRVEKGV